MVNKPKPTELKKLEGNPGKRPLNDSIRPAVGMLTCPKVLSHSARAEWKRIVPELQVLGLLTKIDRAAIISYCDAYGRYMDALKTLKEKGPLYKTANGNVITSPMLWVANKANEQMHRWITEFGMTPSSRTRISAPTHGARDEMEDLLDSNRDN